MSSNDPTDSPLDRALQLALAGDEEASLRLGASEVKSDLENAGALYAIGRALVAMDKTALARRAFECAAGVANNAGNLPLAIAAGAELRVLGKNPTALWDNLAAGYCDGASRLLEGVAKPPAIQHRAPKSGAIGDGVRGQGRERLALRHAIVGETRGLGVFHALELVSDRKHRTPLAADAMTEIKHALLAEGMLPFVAGNRIHVVPPCIIGEDEVERGLATLDKVLGEMSAKYAA